MITSYNLSTTTKSISSSTIWEVSPDSYSARKDYLHIWKVDLGQFPYDENDLSVLSDKEYMRVSRIIDPHKQKQLHAAHLALRYILSQYLGVLPGLIKFQYSQFGKPYLDMGSDKPSIFFNLSHSAECMLLALTSESHVGIDLEQILPVSSTDRIIQNYFSSDDVDFYQRRPQDDKNTAFFYLWTLKEAYGKALGSGISGTPKRAFSKKDNFKILQNGQFSAFHQNDCWFYSFIPEDKFIATVAVKSLNIPVPQFFSYTYGKTTGKYRM